VALATSTANVSALTDAVRALAPGGLLVEEPYVPLGPEEGARLEPWRPTLVKLFFPRDADLAGRLGRLNAQVDGLPFDVQRSERLVEQEDWAENWKQFFQIEHVGERLVIRPTWRPYEPSTEEIVIDLDPGMAFGTGQHPTTRLCLAAIERLLKPASEVLDLGCGSGILSLAAAKLGARSVLALDIDPIAVEATRANSKLNGVERIVSAARGSLGDAMPAGAASSGPFALIVANISAAVLVDLAGAIAASLRPQGRLIASGIIADHTDNVLIAFAAAGLHSEQIFSEADWRAIVSRTP
jgi:ribosomal protein L11 methyltransferase